MSAYNEDDVCWETGNEYDTCWESGGYIDQNCELCPYRYECLGYEGEDDDYD